MNKKIYTLALFVIFISLFAESVYANYYVADIYFTLPKTAYVTNEQIELKGNLSQSNYTNASVLVSTSSLTNTSINFTIRDSDNVQISNFTLTTDSTGAFYTKSAYSSSSVQINASSQAGNYYLRAEYVDPSNATHFSESEIVVINKTLDLIRVSSEKSRYYPSETILAEIEAVNIVGDQLFYTSGVSINGSLRNATKHTISNFSCTTSSNGRCTVSLSGPATYGSYFLELEDFKSYSSFLVVPFQFSSYMKDELGKSLKNVYALGEQARIEVSVSNASSSDRYTFSGYIADSSGNVLKTVNSTELNSNNSFTNSFLFTVDAITFSYGAYITSLTISKLGDGNITSITSFEVKDWALSFEKRDTSSGFENEHNSFPNKTLYFEIYPTYRSNGTVIPGVNSSLFTVSLLDNLNNPLSTGNVSWNASCSKSGCYTFSIDSPSTTGKYLISLTLSYSGATQEKSQIINVLTSLISAQSTSKEGSLKELFGTSEPVYLSLSSYNSTASQANLTDAQVSIIRYMNGSEISYTQVSSFDLVNSTNSVYEWAWNSSSQMLKLDAPKSGGVYTALVYGNNQTSGATAKFIINPYDVCTVPKDTPGQVSSGYYYIWQFKTTDTVYFELKLVQANNPLGRATASNSSGGNSSSYGKGSQCSVNTATQQVISNATLSVVEVKNTESGASQNFNSSDSVCQASDNSGGYTCTVKPLSKWEGGGNVVKFLISSQDGTEDIAYGRFEAKAFYLYGWANTWQNSPSANVSLTLNLYEAGRGWWGSSGGLSGTVTLKKVEYQGTNGEWIWPPVDSGYNATAVNSSSITSGSGTLTLSAANAPGGVWKTGVYRAVIQGTTSSGDTDYGYAWFGIKLWEVYGQPVECTSSGCNYKSYYNSKENITLYLKVSPAGSYNYNDAGKQSIGGNITISVKKIEDCRSWPCKELNSSAYTATSINVNESSPWYWNANLNNSRYLLYINKTSSTWGTGYYSVTLNLNGTDTGNAWFNTVAFYVETQPTDVNGTNYKYSIRGNSQMYFNVSTVSSYKSGYYSGSSYIRYQSSDYVNVTLDSVTLRTWDQETYAQKEYSYPNDINVTPTQLNGSALLNITYNNGTWPSGYYYGELTLRSSDNETSTGWLYFNVRPFRAEISTSSYNIDVDQCVNSTLNIYDPDWYSNTLLASNYTISSVYENVWSNSGQTKTTYTNYTATTFNSTLNFVICPNPATGQWGDGSWGGYHYLSVQVRDTITNETETGWLYFRAVPFSVSWGSVSGGSSKLTNQQVQVPVTITKYSTGSNSSANLTRIYQWRYDDAYNGLQEYVFSVGSCYSNVSGSCTINGTQTLTIYPPSSGWRVGYNYLYADWTKERDASSTIQDWSGVYIEGRSVYNGYFQNYDASGAWKYYTAPTENITIRIVVQDQNYNSINANVTNVQLSYPDDSCSGEWCRSYQSTTWSLVGGGTQTSSGQATITIKPSSSWPTGVYYVKASISGSGGTATIIGGSVRVKDFTGPNLTISSPVNNQTISNSTFILNATTTENAQCSFSIYNYNTLNSSYCGGWNNNTNGSTTSQKVNACNSTAYGFAGNTYHSEYVAQSYHSGYNGTAWWWTDGSTSMTTGGTLHSFTFNATSWPTQHYGAFLYCYDSDYNSISEVVAFKVNVTGT